MLVMNTLAVMLPLNGKTTGELSDKYPNLFVPAGFTFAIWSVIFLLLIGMVGYQWYSGEKSKQSELGIWFIVNMVLNGLWVVVWHYEIVPLSIVIMLGLLFSLMMLYRKLDVSYFGDHGIQWLVNVPVSVYFGWISVATIANFTTVLVNYNWSGFGLSEDKWASVMLCVAVGIGLYMLRKFRDIFFALVLTWASYGIYSKRIADTIAQDDSIQHVAYMAIFILIIGTVLTIVLATVRKNKSIL